jgi:hypothetical protein
LQIVDHSLIRRHEFAILLLCGQDVKDVIQPGTRFQGDFNLRATKGRVGNKTGLRGQEIKVEAFSLQRANSGLNGVPPMKCRLAASGPA